MSESKRVVVTGMGVIAPVGNTVEECWASVVAGGRAWGRSRASTPRRLETRIAGEVKDFDPEQYIPAKEARRMDRFIQFAVAAAGQALESARLHRHAGERAARSAC